MTLDTQALAHLLAALALLLVAAHAGGHLFRRLRQPEVIGEILGGLLLGPTVLGAVVPDVHAALWERVASTGTVAGALYHLGLLLLMFCSGLQVRRRFERGEGRSVVALTVSGIALPFLATLALGRFIVVEDHLGPAGSRAALLLVLATAVAITSIPVISRILYDLGLLDTAFARIVLTAAVVEDAFLYVAVAIALALAGPTGNEAFGLPAFLGIEGASPIAFAYHIGITLAFFAVALAAGPALFDWGRRHPVVRQNNPVALLLLLGVSFSLVALALGIAPFLGAFVAGLSANRAGVDTSGARETIQRFSFAFPIPVYFAIVGLRLDLLRQFDGLFFLAFLAYACVAKLASAYAGARIAGERRLGAFNLAVAMNARGGPGIVLASVALDAGIVHERLYSVLVMLAVVTSFLAGSWLQFVIGRRWPLR